MSSLSFSSKIQFQNALKGYLYKVQLFDFQILAHKSSHLTFAALSLAHSHL